MNEMNIKSVQYISDEIRGKASCINATIDGINMYIPLDLANRHYAEIMRQVEAGTLTIQPADEPETTE